MPLYFDLLSIGGWMAWQNRLYFKIFLLVHWWCRRRWWWRGGGRVVLHAAHVGLAGLDQDPCHRHKHCQQKSARSRLFCQFPQLTWIWMSLTIPGASGLGNRTWFFGNGYKYSIVITWSPGCAPSPPGRSRWQRWWCLPWSPATTTWLPCPYLEWSKDALLIRRERWESMRNLQRPW